MNRFVTYKRLPNQAKPFLLSLWHERKPPRRISNHSLMAPINLMKYTCATEITHLNFGKSELLVFGIQVCVCVCCEGEEGGRGLLWDALSNFPVSLDCFRALWHFAFIVRPISHVHCASSPPTPWAPCHGANCSGSSGASPPGFPSQSAVNCLRLLMQWSFKTECVWNTLADE